MTEKTCSSVSDIENMQRDVAEVQHAAVLQEVMDANLSASQRSLISGGEALKKALMALQPAVDKPTNWKDGELTLVDFAGPNGAVLTSDKKPISVK